MGFIVQDSFRFNTIGLNLQGFIVTTRANYTLFKNQGVVTVRLTEYIFADMSAYTGDKQPVLAFQKDIIVPAESLSDPIGFVYNTLKQDFVPCQIQDC